MTDEYLKARAHIQAQVQKHETELKYWRDELAAFDRVETAVRRLSANGDTAPAPATAGDKTPVKRGELKSRVLASVLNQQGKLISSKEVERKLLADGYAPKGNTSTFRFTKRCCDSPTIKRRLA